MVMISSRSSPFHPFAFLRRFLAVERLIAGLRGHFAETRNVFADAFLVMRF